MLLVGRVRRQWLRRDTRRNLLGFCSVNVGHIRGRAVKGCRRIDRFDFLRHVGQAFRADALRLGRRRVGDRLELGVCFGHDRFDVVASVLERELLMSRETAIPGPGQRLVRAALAVREHRGAATREFLAFGAGAVGGSRLGLGELGVGLNVDLPAGQPRRKPGIEALLADRQRELVVGNDDRRFLRLVVDEDLADTRGRKRLRDEARRLRVPRDDVDLLAAELRNDHPDAGTARPDTGADRIDALGMRLDSDLRAIAGLAGDAADLDEAVGDLRHFELEERLDQLGIATRQDDLRPLGARANLGDDGLDARALLVALAVHLLGARQERFHLAEVDEHVVAVAGLLDDSGHDLGDAIDVFVVHHRALRFADALQNHLLRGLRGDPAEVLRRDVLTLDQVLRDVRPVDVEVVIRDECVGALTGLDLECLELLELSLASLFDQALLDVGRQLDREHTEVTLVVDLDDRVPCGSGHLLVSGEQGVLERRDERAALDSLLALDISYGLDDFLAHLFPASSIRLPRTMASYGMSTDLPLVSTVTAASPAATTSPRTRLRSVVRSATRRPTASRKCAGLRSGRSRPGDETSTE